MENIAKTILLLVLHLGTLTTLSQDIQLNYASFIGGSGYENITSFVIDELGNVYATGTTDSNNLPTTTGAHQPDYGGGSFDAFIVKFNTNHNIEWCTYFGGTNEDFILAIDYANETIFFTGYTDSGSGIASQGSFDTSYAGDADCFVASMNTEGEVLWATYYGGAGSDLGYSIKVTQNNEIIVGGETSSATGIAFSDVFQPTLYGETDALLLKLNDQGEPLWATYFGGEGLDSIRDLAITPNGTIVFGGITRSAENIVFGNAAQSSLNAMQDGLLGSMTESGDLLWASYFGGNEFDEIRTLFSDNDHILVAGNTTSESDFPVTANAFQTGYSGGLNDGFMSKFTLDGENLYCTYIGGDDADLIEKVLKVDDGYFLFGSSISDGLGSAGAYQENNGGVRDALLMKFNTDHELTYSTYFGDIDNDRGFDMSLYNNQIILVGETGSIDNISTPDAQQTNNAGQYDGFIAVFDQLTFVSEIKMTGPLIYPNPAHQYFSIQSNEKLVSISLFDANGQLVAGYTDLNISNYSFNASNLSSGCYNAKIQTASGRMFAQKIIVQ